MILKSTKMIQTRPKISPKMTKNLNKKPYFVSVCIKSAAELLQFSDFYFQHVSGWKVFKAMLIMIVGRNVKNPGNCMVSPPYKMSPP